jgi:hypothetical protein
MFYWYINVLPDMLCILGSVFFKIIAVIGGFLMPTACSFSVSPLRTGIGIGVLIVLKLGY